MPPAFAGTNRTPGATHWLPMPLPLPACFPRACAFFGMNRQLAAGVCGDVWAFRLCRRCAVDTGGWRTGGLLPFKLLPASAWCWRFGGGRLRTFVVWACCWQRHAIALSARCRLSTAAMAACSLSLLAGLGFGLYRVLGSLSGLVALCSVAECGGSLLPLWNKSFGACNFSLPPSLWDGWFVALRDVRVPLLLLCTATCHCHRACSSCYRLPTRCLFLPTLQADGVSAGLADGALWFASPRHTHTCLRIYGRTALPRVCGRTFHIRRWFQRHTRGRFIPAPVRGAACARYPMPVTTAVCLYSPFRCCATCLLRLLVRRTASDLHAG